MSTSFGLTIEFSRNEKLQKCIIFPSHDTNYLHKWLVHFLTCLLVLWLFFFCKNSEICAIQERDDPPWLAFYGNGLASQPSWLSMVNAGWLGFIKLAIFFQMELIILQGCSIKQATSLRGEPPPYNQLLIQPFLLIPECYFE